MSSASHRLLLVPGLFALACAEPTDPPPDRVDPDGVGPYVIGATTLELTDPRYERPIKVEVWYPAVDPGRPTDFYPDIAIPTTAHRDAPIDVRGAPYPVIAFSHGYSGIRYQSAFLMEHLASHGFVVVSPDHPRNTMMDIDSDLTGQVLVDRPGDVIRSVDGLFAAPRFAGLVETHRYAMTGHSFGGLTTLVIGGAVFDFDYGLAHCAESDEAGCAFFEDSVLGDPALATPDPRAVVGVDISPGGWYAFGEHGLDGVVPMLAIAGSRDADLPYDSEGLPLMDRLPAPKRTVTLENAGHWGVTDLCTVIPFFDDCLGEADGWMEPDRVQWVTATLVTAYVADALTDDPRYAGWLEPGAWTEGDVVVEVVP